MKAKNMTALVSAFSRAYHTKNNPFPVFNDDIALKFIGGKEYLQISENMKNGINFFNPGFTGTDEEAVRWVVDNQLSPTPLGRAAFAERKLKQAVACGSEQYVIWAAGYDTFAYRQPDYAANIRIFEADHPMTSGDKKERLLRSGIAIPDNLFFIAADFNCDDIIPCFKAEAAFDFSAVSFHSILGLCYYLDKNVFQNMLFDISGISPEGSSIVFDYPDELALSPKAGQRMQKQVMLAAGAGEEMKACYSPEDISELLGSAGFKIHELLTPADITKAYFSSFNSNNPGSMISAFDNVNYCFAVKEQ